MAFAEPWVEIEESRNAAFVEELRRELPADSVLHGREVRAVAQRVDCDDVLFGLADSEQCAVVHLTWSGRRERLPWPSTQLFLNAEEFQTKRMRPDAEVYK